MPQTAANHRLAYALLAFTILVWGVAPAFIRSFSTAMGPADALVIRTALVAVLSIPLLAFTGGFLFARQDIPRLLLASCVGLFGYFVGSIYGFTHVTSGIGGIIISTQPLLIALLSSFFGVERLTLATIAGLAISFAGTVLLLSGDAGNAITHTDLVIGSAMIFASGVCWALYVLVSRPLIQAYGAFRITLASSILSAIPALAFASKATLPAFFSMDINTAFSLFYLTIIGTLLTISTWNYAAGILRPTTVGAALYLIPVLAALSGLMLMGESLTFTILVSGAIILAGVAVAQFGGTIRMGGSGAAILAVLVAVTFWGLIPVAMRYLILGLSPETAMVLRLYPAGVIATLFALYVGVREIAWRDWGRIIIAALLGNIGYQVLAAYGMQGVPAAWTGLLFGLEPVFIALLAVLLAKEQLTIWLVAGIGLSLLGTAALMAGAGLAPAGDVSPWGLLLITISTMGWGIYTVVIKPVAAKYGSFPVACLAMGISALPMAFFVPPDFPVVVAAMTGTQWLAVAYVVICGTFLATSLWNYALGHMNSSLAGIFLYVQPIVAGIGGVLILGEHITWPLVAGGALIIAGVAVAQFGPMLMKNQVQQSRPSRRVAP